VATIEKVKNKKRLVSATTIIVAVLILVIAANAVVWKNRLAKNSELDLLTGQIAQVSREIKNSPEPPANLQARLTEASANLTAAQTVFPVQFNRNDIIDYIINLSRECKVEVLPISSQGWVVEKSSQLYPVLKLNATVTGSFTQTNEFIYKLQHGKYMTLIVPEISITRQTSTESSGSFSGEKTAVTVRVNISIYARPAAAKGN
jgi:Tfp pilus assembly protein PilO